MRNKPRIKRRKLREELHALLSEIERHIVDESDENRNDNLYEHADAIFQVLTPNEPVTESDYTGPISTWIEHFNIDESWVDITNISGGNVTLTFEERIWREWKKVNPNGQNANAGGSIGSNREVDSNVYDGDHRLKVECDDSVSYHLKFRSKDR